VTTIVSVIDKDILIPHAEPKTNRLIPQGIHNYVGADGSW